MTGAAEEALAALGPADALEEAVPRDGEEPAWKARLEKARKVRAENLERERQKEARRERAERRRKERERRELYAGRVLRRARFMERARRELESIRSTGRLPDGSTVG